MNVLRKNLLIAALLMTCVLAGSPAHAAKITYIDFKGVALNDSDLTLIIEVIKDDNTVEVCTVTVLVSVGDDAAEKATNTKTAINDQCGDKVKASMWGSRKVKIKVQNGYKKIKSMKHTDLSDLHSFQVNGVKEKNSLFTISLDGQCDSIPDSAKCEIDDFHGNFVTVSTPMAYKTGDQIEAELAALLAAEDIEAVIAGGDLVVILDGPYDSVEFSLDYSTSGPCFTEASYFECRVIDDIPTLTEWGMIIFCALLFGWMAWVIVRRRKAVNVRI